MWYQKRKAERLTLPFFSVEPSPKLSVESPESVYRYELAAFVIHTHTFRLVLHYRNVVCQAVLLAY